MAFEAWVKSKYGNKVNVGKVWEQSEQEGETSMVGISVLNCDKEAGRPSFRGDFRR